MINDLHNTMSLAREHQARLAGDARRVSLVREARAARKAARAARKAARTADRVVEPTTASSAWDRMLGRAAAVRGRIVTPQLVDTSAVSTEVPEAAEAPAEQPTS